MTDYTYKPNYSLDDYTENQDIVLPNQQPNIEASTTLNELDQIDIINRHGDEFAKIESVDNKYPDILKKPLYTKVVPDGGLLVSPNTSNERTSELTGKANTNTDKKNNNLSNISIKDFASSIANSLMEILNDLLSYKWGEDDFISIFTKEERLLAIGVLFIIISVFLIFFKNTE